MSEETSHSENNIIEQLKEENNKLKLLLQKRNIDHLSITSGKINVGSDLFEKARSISNIAYWRFSVKNNKLEFSEEAYKIFEGMPPRVDLDEDYFLKYLHPKESKRFVDEWRKKVETDNYFEIESSIIIPDGSIKFILIKVLVERDKKLNPILLTGTITDQTEIHFKFENLRGNNELFHNLFNNLTDIFIIFELVTDQNGDIIDYIYKDVNPTFEMKMGLSINEIRNKKFSVQLSLFEQFHPLFKLSVIIAQPQQDRFFIQSLDSFFDVLIYSPTENYIATIWRDVSLMVDAESSLRESEEKYRQIFSIGSDALFMVDFENGRIMDVNPIGCMIFGYSKGSLLNMFFKQLSVTPDKLEEQILNQKSTFLDEIALKEDKTKFPIEISLSYFYWRGRKVFVASIRDISERINEQEKLIKSEQKYKQLFNFSNDAILIIKHYRIVDFNQKSASLFQLKFEQLINKTLWNLSPDKQLDDNDSRTRAIEYIQNSLLGNQLQFEWIFQRNDESLFYADIKLSPIFYGDEKVIQAIVRDISSQKKTYQALLKKEELWKNALQINAIGVWDWNIITNEIYFSQTWKSMLGYEKDEIKNEFEEFQKKLHPDDVIHFYNQIDDYLISKSDSFIVDVRMRCKNGTYKWVHSVGKIYSFNNEGKPKLFLGTNYDITKQKIQEEKLSLEIKELTEASFISQVGYWKLDLRTMIVSGSRNTFSIFGFSEVEQLSLRQIELLIHSEDRTNFITQFVSQPENLNFENIFRITVNNQIKYIISKSYPVRNNNNILTGFTGTFQDISSLKRDDNLLKDEKYFFKSLIDNFRQPIQVIQNDKILFSNERTIELIGFSNKEIISKNITPIIITVPEDRIHLKKILDTILSNPKLSEKIELRIETKNNRIKWIELTISSLIIKDNQAIIYVMNDISTQKKIESELLFSEKKFKSITLNSTNGVAIVDQSELILYSNQSFHTISGFGVSELKKKSYKSIFSKFDSDSISRGIDAINRSLATQFSDEFLLIGENKCWINLTVKPVSTSKNIIDYFIFYLDPIDSKHQLAEKLDDSNFMLKILFENSPFGIALFNNKLELIFFNQKFSNQFELKSGLKQKTKLVDIEPFIEHKTQISNQVLKENNSLNIDLQTPQNKYFRIQISPVSIKNENSLIIYSNDFTESKNKIDSLIQQVEKLQDIFEHTTIGIALVDKNRNIIFSNNKFTQLLNYESNDQSLIKLDRLVETQYLGEIISGFSQLFTGISTSFHVVFQSILKNNINNWFRSSASPLKDKFGDVSHAVFIIEDISQYKNEEQILINNERLQTLNYIANSFAHEFNNLLMVIYGNSYLLKSQLKDTKLVEYATKLLTSTNRATELTHKLLSFSGKNNLISIALDINELINSSLKSFRISPTIHINIITSNKNEKIVGDSSQLKRAFQNIIKNAVDSMPNGGELTIETKTVYFDSILPNDFSDVKKGKYLRIMISDTGIGIQPNELPKIFDPFYSTKPFSLNAGLGLSISQRIIDMHEGVIKAYSTLGKGTIINIYLPLKNLENFKENNQPNENQIIKGSANILLIDDEEIVRLITSELLNELGYDIYSFSSGEKALQFYKDNYQTIDLVMLDKQMPYMDGVEVYRKMIEINPKVKVIILTGYNIDKEMEEIFGKDSNRIIQKPVNIEKLSQTIVDVLFNVI
jgi:PAS domain S-box-containing protein